MTTETTAGSRDYLDTLAKVAALAAVLVPAAGVITRFVAFSADPPTRGTWELAYSAPFLQLVVNGALSLLIVGGAITLWSFWVAAMHRSYRHRRPWSAVIREISFAVVFFALYVAFFPDWPVVLILLPAILASLLAVRIAGWRATPLTMRQAWPLVVLVMLIGSIAVGLSEDVTGVGGRHIAFVQGAPLADGRYAPLAVEGDLLFLQKCDGASAEVVAVHQSAIASEALDRSASYGPSLFDVLFRGKRSRELGRQRLCG